MKVEILQRYLTNKMIIKDYYEQHQANIQHNLEEMDEFLEKNNLLKIKSKERKSLKRKGNQERKRRRQDEAQVNYLPEKKNSEFSHTLKE